MPGKASVTSGHPCAPNHPLTGHRLGAGPRLQPAASPPLRFTPILKELGTEGPRTPHLRPHIPTMSSPRARELLTQGPALTLTDGHAAALPGLGSKSRQKKRCQKEKKKPCHMLLRGRSRQPRGRGDGWGVSRGSGSLHDRPVLCSGTSCQEGPRRYF